MCAHASFPPVPRTQTRLEAERIIALESHCQWLANRVTQLQQLVDALQVPLSSPSPLCACGCICVCVCVLRQRGLAGRYVTIAAK